MIVDFDLFQSTSRSIEDFSIRQNEYSQLKNDLNPFKQSFYIPPWSKYMALAAKRPQKV